jgi:cell division protein FtsL
VKARGRFLLGWTLATVAAVTAFVVHLALRGRTVQLGYALGRARAEEARLREVRRVLELEAASYRTPERVELVARTILGMEPPAPDRIVTIHAPSLAREGRPSGRTAELTPPVPTPPALMQPVPTQPGSAQPGSAQPGSAQPGSAQPAAAPVTSAAVASGAEVP